MYAFTCHLSVLSVICCVYFSSVGRTALRAYLVVVYNTRLVRGLSLLFLLFHWALCCAESDSLLTSNSSSPPLFFFFVKWALFPLHLLPPTSYTPSSPSAYETHTTPRRQWMEKQTVMQRAEERHIALSS